MIELVTGLPGNAKTLFTIADIKARAERENRQVFYHGIPELTLPWEPLADPKDWASVPPNSIVVIDEAQKTFRNRSLGSQPPQFVTDLETHRHLGIDIVMITQHPSLIDPAVRRLAGRHRHLVRIWGMEASTVHRWDSVKDNCDKSRADSEKTKWAFDKSLYGVYKSAEVHTMKRTIPFRAKLIAVLLVLFACAAVYMVNFLKKKTTASDASNVPAATAPSAQAGAGGVRPRGPVDARADAQDYMWRETPRVAGVQHTAPKYDELTKPVRVPVPAACIQIRSECKCLTQQGTPYETDRLSCLQFVRTGYFQEFDEEGRREGNTGAMERREPVTVAQASPVEVAGRGSQVVMFDKVPSDVPTTPSGGAKK